MTACDSINLATKFGEYTSKLTLGTARNHNIVKFPNI